MKCSRCNRPLYFVTAQIGSQAFGPKCAALMGLLAAVKGLRRSGRKSPESKRKPRKARETDQLDMFDLLQESIPPDTAQQSS